MSMLEDLKKDASWDAFFQYKKERKHFSVREEREWEAFIAEKQYREFVGRLTEEDFTFDDPEKIPVNKSGIGKKRIVYSFGEKETAVLKVMAFLLYRYDDTDEKKFSWSRWFFPVLTTDEGLKEMDAYLIRYIRYLYKGRHYKGNYRVTYEQIKALGFRSLVNEFYKNKED